MKLTKEEYKRRKQLKAEIKQKNNEYRKNHIISGVNFSGCKYDVANIDGLGYMHFLQMLAIRNSRRKQWCLD